LWYKKRREAMKEFGRDMYVDGTTVAECGEDIWNKFRQYIAEKCDCGAVWGAYSHAHFDTAVFIHYNYFGWESIRWVGDREKYTKRNILDILTHHGYIEPSEHNSKESNMKITDVKVGSWMSNETMRKLSDEQFYMLESALKSHGTHIHTASPHNTDFDYGIWDHGTGSGVNFGTISNRRHYNNEITYEDILSIIGHTPKQQEKRKLFARDMLKPGMFCKCRNGSMFVVVENERIVDVTGGDAGYGYGCYDLTDALTDEITNIHCKKEYDVIAISHTFDFESPIWERDVKEEEREKIRQEIVEMEESLKAKKEALENI